MALAWTKECHGVVIKEYIQKRDFADKTGSAGTRINVKMRGAKGDSEVCD